MLISNLFAINDSPTVAPIWPTACTPFVDGKLKPIGDFIQPTASGVPESGLFGCVRSNGCKFHEGIDIKPNKRDRKGEPLDAVMSIWPGKVVWVNTKPGNSGYGNYVVVEHSTTPAVYSLYGHLK
ncbi:MAG TPA: M23 family metallopeptidase, partial [Opitutales bacterium]|nr:M23 family metallopeptidase [Opitutales bacterium]